MTAVVTRVDHHATHARPPVTMVTARGRRAVRVVVGGGGARGDSQHGCETAAASAQRMAAISDGVPHVREYVVRRWSNQTHTVVDVTAAAAAAASEHSHEGAGGKRGSTPVAASLSLRGTPARPRGRVVAISTITSPPTTTGRHLPPATASGGRCSCFGRRCRHRRHHRRRAGAATAPPPTGGNHVHRHPLQASRCPLRRPTPNTVPAAQSRAAIGARSGHQPEPGTTRSARETCEERVCLFAISVLKHRGAP